MSAAAPTIPPRPARAQQAAAARGANKLPEIPPRPIPKRLDRSVSPGNYPRSPLNEPFLALSKTKSQDATAQAVLPRRPSVQHLPSVGQEGMEYADVDAPQDSPVAPAEQTRSVAHDLQLHAPKPSLPKSAAAAQVQAVTRTDSGQAAAHGFGKPGTPGHDDHHDNDNLGRVRSRASFSRPNSSASGTARRASIAEEHGPAELGLRVPINPLLGDVQAPSPAPFTPSHTGEKGRRSHSRMKSRDGLPPGSYGLHGHGVPSTDPFERDWYAKHPDELQHEEAHGHGVYEGIGSGRGAFALSSDDLNKIVRDTASRGAGFGTTGNTTSYPDEQIGYMVNDNYVHQGGNALTKSLTNVSQPAVESPLRKSSLPAADMDPIVSVHSRRNFSGSSDHDIEDRQQTPVHIDLPELRYNKITGGEETMNETAEHGAALSRPTTGQGQDSDYSAPILAADEVAKEHGGDYMQAAISPRLDRRSSEYEYMSGEVTPTSRPASRPSSIHGMHSGSYGLSRFVSHLDERDNMHTPLEDVDEYEPLFPEEESKSKELPHAERFKQRPDIMKHRFPSKDIWEDAPDHGMYQATVSTPDLVQDYAPKPSAAFESPEQEAAGKGERSEGERRKLVQKAALPSHLQAEATTRPGLQPRFPSQDIWEDSPDSQHLVSTVRSPPVPDETSPVEAINKPMIPPRPSNKSKLAEGLLATQPAPVVPARPAKKTSDDSASLTREVSPTELKKVPSIPDRPKPQVPPRPAKKPSSEALTKTISPEGHSNDTETVSPPLTKVKPQVPARPAQSSKFAGLRGNFMNDLNQKLGLGPPKEKDPEPEPEVEAKPLEDARKGRARGPQRRAPAKSPSAAAAPATDKPRFAMYKAQSLWHIGDEGLLNIGSVEALNNAATEKGFAADDEAVPVDVEKMEQLGNATINDAPAPPAVDTTVETKGQQEETKRPDDAPPPLAPNLATNAQGESPDPVLVAPAPVEEKGNPLSHQATNEEAFLSQRTTVSSIAASGAELEREVPDPSTDAIPASQQTTASIHSGAELERVETKAPEEPIQLRDEQVNAPSPGAAAPISVKSSAPEPQAIPAVTKEQVQDIAAGADHAAEPMPEQDVSYAQLEAMQMQADGKELSDGGVKKVVD